MPWEKWISCSDAENIHRLSEMLWPGTGEHSVQKRWAIRGDAHAAARGQVSRPGGRCFGQRVWKLLGVLDQVLHAAVQGDRPHEQVQVVEEFW